jgi:hypothetical protein
VRCFENVAAYLTDHGSFVVEAFVPAFPTGLTNDQYVDAEAIEVDEVRLDVGRYDPQAAQGAQSWRPHDDGGATGNNLSMAPAQMVQVRREVLLDERGDALRATWHPHERVVVLSEWRSGICRATFQLDPSDSARLAAFLVAAVGEAATSVPAHEGTRRSLVERVRSLLRLNGD